MGSGFSSSLQRAELWAVDALKRMQSFLSLFLEVYDQTGMQAPLDQVTQAAVKLGLQAPLLPRHRHRKMPSRYFEGNAQPVHHSNVEDFYCQIYFETGHGS